MNILEKIVKWKISEINLRKVRCSIEELKESNLYNRICFSLRSNLMKNQGNGIIAEFKRASPSRGIINKFVKPKDVIRKYESLSVAGISVLTDKKFFQGINADLLESRLYSISPLLRKDFIIDNYQIHEAKSLGADVILLIASILSKNKLLQLAKCAKLLGLEVILEIHCKEEIEYYNDSVDIIGVNNRNLKTFKVDIDNSKRIYPFLPKDAVKISESGLDNLKSIEGLRHIGYHGFLIGESLMREKFN